MAPLRPKIGFIACVHPIYDLPRVALLRREAADALRALGCEVAETEIPHSVADAARIAGSLRDANVDVVALFFCTWVAEDITLALARMADDVPMLLWALPYLDRDIPMPSPISGLVGSASNIRLSGKPFAWTIGRPAERAEEVARAAKAAQVTRMLRHARFGVVGDPCPGMLDVAMDETELRTALGPEVAHFELESLMERARAVASEDAASAAWRLRGRSEIDDRALADNLRLYVAVNDLVREHELDGYCVRCWPELRDRHKITPCAAHALMAEDGVPSTCEVDLPALVTTFVLCRLAGAPAFNFDITGYLEEEGAIQFAHCGAAAPSLAENSGCVHVRTHMRTGTGATVEFPFKPGVVTLAKLLRPVNGRFRLFTAVGEAIRPPAEVRGSVATVRPQPSSAAFMDAAIREGVEHHLVLVYGDWTGELRYLCQFTGVEHVPAAGPGQEWR